MFFMFHLFDDRFIQFGVTVGSLDVPSMPITRVLFWPFQNLPYLWTLVRIASSKVFFLLLLALCDSMNVWLVLLRQLVITLPVFMPSDSIIVEDVTDEESDDEDNDFPPLSIEDDLSANPLDNDLLHK